MKSPQLQLAGQFANVGNSLLGTARDWAEMALPTVLLLIVVVTAARKFSVRAAIGALIGLALCMGIYHSRGALSDAFTDEINNPAKGAGTTVRQVTDQTPPPLYRQSIETAGGVL
ncbi:hypothetical protein [Streptomyces sp. NPDC026673]|uniref:hypothetical protein n=1 Tax=Streptomyces sp. NPDC026673 TaxID=3155724 RepID=UPI0033FCD543